MQARLTDLHKRISCWSNPDKIDNLEHLRQMEDSLTESLHRLRIQKENAGKQLMSLDCSSQFQNGMHLPLLIGGVQEAQPLSWLPNNENQHMIFHDDPNFLHHRDMPCPTSTEATLQSFPTYFGAGNHTTLVENTGQGINTVNELSRSNCLRQQVNEQYPCPSSYSSLNLTDENKLKPDSAQMNFQKSTVDYHQVSNGNFELHRPLYDGRNQNSTWVSPSGSCSVLMFDEHPSYPQQPN